MDTPVAARALGLIALVLALVIAVILLVTGLPSARSAAATTTPVPTAAPGPGVTVTGTARVEGVPDTLRIDIGVNVVESSVDVALTKANEASAALLKTLQDNGVEERDIATTQISIQPQYDYSGNTQRITGYQVTQAVRATLRDVETAGEIIGKAAASGGDSTIINGISFDLEDNEALLKDARKRAVADARAKAEEYADAAGRSLGDVVSISEASIETPAPYRMDATMAGAAEDGAAMPLSPGTQTVRVDVSVVYSFR